MGVGALIFHTVENPHVMIVGPPYSQFSVSVNSINHGPCSTVYLLLKNLHVIGPRKFKLVLFKGQLYFLTKQDKIKTKISSNI